MCGWITIEKRTFVVKKFKNSLALYAKKEEFNAKVIKTRNFFIYQENWDEKEGTLKFKNYGWKEKKREEIEDMVKRQS